MENIIFRSDELGKPIENERWKGEFCNAVGTPPVLKIYDDNNKIVELNPDETIYYSDKDFEQNSGVFKVKEKYGDRYYVVRM